MGRMRALLWSLGALLISPIFIGNEGGVQSVSANAMVAGTVFCDQCKDGQRSLFDYPLRGAKVAVACGGAEGAPTAYKEETTNWFGSYSVRFEGDPDLSQCHAKVVDGPDSCGEEVGPAQGLNLVFRMFGIEMYTAGPLLSQPRQPMSMCPNARAPAPPSHSVGVAPPHPTPMLPLLPPPFGGSRPPPPPLLETYACSYDKWMMPEYKCYWKAVAPESKVALEFGPIAAGRYGTDMTLLEGLHGRGDLYRTLLREATTSLLNSYNSEFFFPPLFVVDHMNRALLGSQQQALMIALRFKRANSGISARRPPVSCNFTPCS